MVGEEDKEVEGELEGVDEGVGEKERLADGELLWVPLGVFVGVLDHDGVWVGVMELVGVFVGENVGV